uniref:SAM domain-containing protein n=1 Tax=Ditylenchus dipsaci TaxID=166011 RepID=A0A915CSU3_9BILA
MQPSNSYTSALSSAASLPPIWNNGSARVYPPNMYNAHQPMFASGAPTMMPTLPPAFNMANVSSYRSPSSPAARQLAAELDELRRVEGNFLAPNQQQQPLYGSSSLPRSLHAKSNSAISIPRQKHSAGGGTATTSGVESDDELARGRQSSATTTNGKFKRGRTRSTIRNFLGKLARSSSQEIRNVPNGHVNSGIRTSVSARLNSIGSLASGPICIRPPVQHFVDWNCEQVCEWMAEAGFNQYVPKIEKELLIKNQLHRKRLRCLLNCIERNTGNVVEPADRMDIHQIMLWLDDIGLPQYRDVFAENLIDGRCFCV